MRGHRGADQENPGSHESGTGDGSTAALTGAAQAAGGRAAGEGFVLLRGMADLPGRLQAFRWRHRLCSGRCGIRAGPEALCLYRILEADGG